MFDFSISTELVATLGLEQLAGPLALLQQKAAPLWQLFLPWVAIFAIFYFLAIRPARLKQQQLAKQIEAITKGDKVITTGGIYGKVAGVDGATLIVEVADGVKIRILKSGIAGLDGEASGS